MASFIVPAGAHVVEIQVLHGRKTVYTTYVRTHRAGSRQTITVPARLVNRLPAGSYKITVRAGATRGTLGPATSHTVRI